MVARFPFEHALPEAAQPAVKIARTLVEAGHEALLAGGCVRDLLLGGVPDDYDVATAARPEQVARLFRRTRLVGAAFAVVLVKMGGRWVEVASFREDGPYLDGRHPVSVTYCDAHRDAGRRDFTVNGMFLDPLRSEVVDYVGGMADLERRLIRAIGQPAERFEEDHLRLLRAVRFAARLSFDIEPGTLAAIREQAPRLARVAAERVRDELERMLSHPTRLAAWRLLGDCGLRPFLWGGAGWSAAEVDRIDRTLARLADDAGFELVLAVLLAERGAGEVERVCRALTCSNDQREVVRWLVSHQADLDQPDEPSLAALKRLLAGPAFGALRDWAGARWAEFADARERAACLDARLAAIPPERVCPPPLVTGDDLIARGVPAGPRYKEILDALYTRQLDEELADRDAALAALDALLASAGGRP